MRLADVAGNGAVRSDPASGCGFKGIAEGDRFQVLEIVHQLRSDAQDHRRLPFTRMSHLLLSESRLGSLRFSPKQPVGCEKQQQIMAVAMALPRFEDSLSARNVVPAMPID